MTPASADTGLDMLMALRRVASTVSEQSRTLSSETGMTIPQLLCMRAIADARSDGGEATVAQVSQDVRLAPSTVSGVLDRLERARLVKRKRNSQDRRQVNLLLTRTGRAKLASVPDLTSQLADGLRSLSPDELDDVLESLRKVVSLLEGRDGHA